MNGFVKALATFVGLYRRIVPITHGWMAGVLSLLGASCHFCRRRLFRCLPPGFSPVRPRIWSSGCSIIRASGLCSGHGVRMGAISHSNKLIADSLIGGSDGWLLHSTCQLAFVASVMAVCLTACSMTIATRPDTEG